MIEVDEKHLIEIARLAKTVARQVRLNAYRKTRRFYASSKLLVEYTQRLLCSKASDGWRSHGTDEEVVKMLNELLREAAATMAVAHDLAQERGFVIKSGIVTKAPSTKPRKKRASRRNLPLLVAFGQKPRRRVA